MYVDVDRDSEASYLSELSSSVKRRTICGTKEEVVTISFSPLDPTLERAGTVVPKIMKDSDTPLVFTKPEMRPECRSISSEKSPPPSRVSSSLFLDLQTRAAR